MGRKTKKDKKDGYVSARTSKKTEEFFKNKKFKGSVASLVLDSFPYVYDEVIKDFKSNFKKSFILKTIESQKGKKIDPKNIERVESLSLAESFIITLWANAFWYGDNDLEEYIK